jgi:hypothetical protein
MTVDEIANAVRANLIESLVILNHTENPNWRATPQIRYAVRTELSLAPGAVVEVELRTASVVVRITKSHTTLHTINVPATGAMVPRVATALLTILKLATETGSQLDQYFRNAGFRVSIGSTEAA